MLPVTSPQVARKISMLLARVCVGFFLTCLVCRVPAQSFFSAAELSPDVALKGDGFYQPTVLGPTGLTGWILNNSFVVREVGAGSPAEGRVQPADIILGVSGKPFGDDLFFAFGEAVMMAELSGSLELTVLREGQEQTVELPMRIFPQQSETWPVECPKSNQILSEAVRYLADMQNPDGSFDTRTRVVYGAVGLAWLASDDAVYLNNCRRLIYWYRNTDQIDDPDNACWGWGYFGVFTAEYYLKTGDRSVLPTCKQLIRKMAESQYRCGGWGHGPLRPGELEGYQYVAGGVLNAAGLGCWLALELYEEAGILDRQGQTALSRARDFFTRFADAGTMPYGDHHPEFNNTGNGKDALACLAFAVNGDSRNAALFARLCTDFYTSRHEGHTGGFLGFIWGNIAGNLNPHRPDYQRMLNYWAPALHVARRWDGAFLMPSGLTGEQYLREGPLFNTAGIALMYAAPKRSLRIYGGKPQLSEKEKKKEMRRSIDAAKQELLQGNPLFARSTALALDATWGGHLSAAWEILDELQSDTYTSIFECAEAYERNRWLIYSNPDSQKVMQEIAQRKDAGIYAQKARALLATSPDASQWLHSAHLVFSTYFGRTNTTDLAGSRRLARMNGVGWMQWVPLNWMKEKGYPTESFLQWNALVPAAGADGTATPVAWRYAADVTAANWSQPDFDDHAWKDSVGPLSKSSDAELNPEPDAQCHYIRIPFEVSNTDLKDWKLWVKNAVRHSEVAVYLNGVCVAWIEPWRDEYRSVDLVPGAMRHLKKGRNVLAARVTHPAIFDIGLYAEESGE